MKVGLTKSKGLITGGIMETPVKIWTSAGVRARAEPHHIPFRLYFGLAYLTLGVSLLMYMGNR